MPTADALYSRQGRQHVGKRSFQREIKKRRYIMKIHTEHCQTKRDTHMETDAQTIKQKEMHALQTVLQHTAFSDRKQMQNESMTTPLGQLVTFAVMSDYSLVEIKIKQCFGKNHTKYKALSFKQVCMQNACPF